MEVIVLANIKSAKKRIRVTERKTAVNKVRRTELKTYIKKLETALANEEVDQAEELLRVLDKKFKKATHKNIIHKNAASRRLSKYTKQLNAIKQ